MRTVVGALVGLIVVGGVAQVPRVELTGVAILPADTFAEGPPSGAFRTAQSRGTPEFPSQPVQGFSSLWPAAPGDADWFALVDNGFGTRANSSDALLRIYRVRVNWARGDVAAPSFIQLSDPDRLLPFPLVRGDTAERWLTGGDLDPESMVRTAGGDFLVGDEFGPFVLRFDSQGRIAAAPETTMGLRSPDAPGDLPPDAGEPSAATVRRSRGFEGLGQGPGSLVYAALEAGPVGDAPATTRIIERDESKGRETGRWWTYPLAAPGHGLTEFVGLAAALGPPCGMRFLTIERDNEQGDRARFKRVFEVTLLAADSGQPGEVQTRQVADLLDIANPNGLGGFGTAFRFPYITTEALWPVDARTLVLVNDNNYPATGGRGPDRDHTEFIRLRLPEPLCSPQASVGSPQASVDPLKTQYDQ